MTSFVWELRAGGRLRPASSREEALDNLGSSAKALPSTPMDASRPLRYSCVLASVVRSAESLSICSKLLLAESMPACCDVLLPMSKPAGESSGSRRGRQQP